MFHHYPYQTEALKNQRTNQKVSAPSLEHKEFNYFIILLPWTFIIFYQNRTLAFDRFKE